MAWGADLIVRVWGEGFVQEDVADLVGVGGGVGLTGVQGVGCREQGVGSRRLGAWRGCERGLVIVFS